MRRIALVAGFLSGSFLVTPASPAVAAEDVGAAASAVARELAQGLRRALGEEAELVMLAELRGSDGTEEANALAASLERALTSEQGMRLVDRKSLAAALQESALGETANDGSLADVARAFGARVLVIGSLASAGDTRTLDLRALAVSTGDVLATARASFGGDGIAVEAHTLAAQLRRLADRLASGLDRLDGDLRYQRIAVLPFEDVGAASTQKQLGLLVASELTTLLRRDHGLMLVERSQLSAIIDELALGQSGLADPATSVEAGRLAGAQGMILGSVSEAGDRFIVHARVVSVADGQVALAEEARLPAADLVALSSDAVVLRTRAGAVYRSVLLPGWGQLYNRQPVKSGLFAGAEVLAGGLALSFELMGRNYHERYAGKPAGTPQEELDELVSKEAASYTRRQWALAALIAIHLANLFDAFVSGKTVDPAALDASGAATLFSF